MIYYFSILDENFWKSFFGNDLHNFGNKLSTLVYQIFQFLSRFFNLALIFQSSFCIYTQRFSIWALSWPFQCFNIIIFQPFFYNFGCTTHIETISIPKNIQDYNPNDKEDDLFNEFSSYQLNHRKSVKWYFIQSKLLLITQP